MGACTDPTRTKRIVSRKDLEDLSWIVLRTLQVIKDNSRGNLQAKRCNRDWLALLVEEYRQYRSFLINARRLHLPRALYSKIVQYHTGKTLKDLESLHSVAGPFRRLS